MKLLAPIAVLLTLSVSAVHPQLGDEQGYVLYIKPATSLVQTTNNNCSQCVTRVGKKGPRGPRGPIGATGPAGSIDVSLMENLQQQLMQQQYAITQLSGSYDVTVQNLTRRIDQLESGSTQTRHNDQLPIRCTELGGMMYESNCFFLLDGSYNFDDAQAACVAKSARLAPVTTSDAYDALGIFLRKIMVAEGKSYINFRLGLTYVPASRGREITSLGGTTVTWNKWHPGNPRSDSTHTAVMWAVRASTTSTSQGFFNYLPSYPYRPLCMM